MSSTILIEIVKAVVGGVFGGIAALSAYYWTVYRLSSEQNLYLAPIVVSRHQVCDINKEKLVASWNRYKDPSPIEEEAYQYFSTLPNNDDNLKAQFKESFPSRLRNHLEQSKVFECDSMSKSGIPAIDRETTVEIAIAMREKTDYLISRACTLEIEGLSIPLQIQPDGMGTAAESTQGTSSPRPKNVLEISKAQSLVAIVSKASEEWDNSPMPESSTTNSSVTCQVLTPEGFKPHTGHSKI